MFKQLVVLFLITLSFCNTLYASPHNTSTNNSSVASSSLDTTKTDWWFIRNKEHKPPEFNNKLPYRLEDYDAVSLGDTSRKVIYLTFDEGYEKGYTPLILDILKENNVKAIFFVTTTYITGNSDIIQRMYEEGHIVGNHTTSHPSMPKLTEDAEKFNRELTTAADKYKAITHQDMPLYFRPPMGHYSEKSLAMTKALGYKTIFWSFAYSDWDINKQPQPDKAKEMMLDGLHNGAIYLLHAVSKTNTEVLGDFIKEARALGYEFELLP
ncbi:MAG: delta-lactam-biosynthetic de-N-acetylase [Clostridia bacterium]|jgi:peptidoglycan-N-acetylmuramic acid deacetylase|nr:delta-lactam-biosynthetic de-N-acetylase [Clostridia bacterium]